MLTGNDVRLLTPELIVVLTATAVYVLGAFLPGRKFWGLVGLAGFVGAGLVLAGQMESFDPNSVRGPLSADMLGYYVRLMAVVVGGVLVLAGSRPENESLTPEYVGTLMMAASGVMLVGAARELVMLFLGLELISIPTYVLLFIGRRDGAGSESAAKYFFLSILSSGVTLYGFSFLYGVGGTTGLAGIREALAGSTSRVDPVLAQLALVLIFAGLGFKIAAVPFHFYAPDVYQGTTNVNAGVLAVLPKIAGITALVRVVSIAMPGVEDTAVRVALILALVTMTLGNVTALWQNDLRRMFAYSSIAHAGYMLIGLAVDFAAAGADKDASVKLQVGGVSAALFYVGVYSAATVGTFAALAYLGGRSKQIDTFDDLAGVGRSSPAVALSVAVFMFSLAGIPPLAGFWGKLYLFNGAINVGMTADAGVKLHAWFILLAVVGVLNAAVAAAYYLRVIGAMYFRDAETNRAPAEGGMGAKVATLACGLIVLVIGLAPRSMAGISDRAAHEARGKSPVQGAAAPIAPPPSHHASR